MNIEMFINEIQNIFYSNPLAQIVGIFALVLNAVCFITIEDKKFLLFMAVSSDIWGFHFLLMNLTSAMMVAFFDIPKNLLALKYPKNHYIFGILILCYMIVGALTFDKQNFISLLPSLNALLSIFFIFYLRGKGLKLGFLLVLSLFFFYNYYVKSLGGMISGFLWLLSSLYGLGRMYFASSSISTQLKEH